MAILADVAPYSREYNNLGKYRPYANGRIYETLREEFYRRPLKGRPQKPNHSNAPRRGTPHTSEWKQAQSARVRQQMLNPAEIEVRRKKARKQFANPTAREISRKAAKENMARPEAREALRAAQTGRIHLFHPGLNTGRRIFPWEVDEYRRMGYVLGRRPRNRHGHASGDKLLLDEEGRESAA